MEILALSSPTDLQELYQIKVKNRFAALSNISSDKRPQEKYDKIVNILERLMTLYFIKNSHTETNGLANR